jgi:hypothetical protein
MAKLTVCNWKEASGGTYAAPGIITGGEVSLGDQWEIVRGASGTRVADPLDIEPRVRLDVDVTDITKGLMGYAFRASQPRGAQQSDIYLQVATDDKGWEINDCVLDSLTVSWSTPGRVTASMEFMGLGATLDTDGIAQVALPATDTAYKAKEMTVTVAAGSVQCVGFDISVSNNHAFTALGDGRSASSLRFPDLLEQGEEDLEYSLTALTQVGTDLAADAPAFTIDSVVTFTNGTVSYTFTFTDMGYGDQPITLRAREDGRVRQALPFMPKPGSCVLT